MMPQVLYRSVAIIVGVALAVSAFAPARVFAAVKGADARNAAPDFALVDENGKTVKLSDLKGKVVLLDFWATWCTGCKVEIPWYVEFQKKYKRRGLASIGVAMDEEGWKTVTPYLRKKPINYQIVVGNDDFAKTYNVTSLPVT